MQVPWKLLPAFVICACSIQAGSAAPQSEAAQSGGSEANRIVAEGCLQRYGWQYFLNERDGTQEQLTGYSKLKDFVGHEIEVTGVRGVKTVDNTPPGGASSVVTHPILNVKSVKDLGTSCPGCN